MGSAEAEEAAGGLRFAREDLAAAQAAVNDDSLAPRHACWASQQAAEKAIKAVLVLEQVDFPKVHDLELLQALVPTGWEVRDVDADLPSLSDWAVAGRYPGEDEATAEEAVAALSAATAVVDVVAGELREKGVE